MYIIQFTSFLDSLQATKTTEQLQSLKKIGIRKMDREHKRKGKFGNWKWNCVSDLDMWMILVDQSCVVYKNGKKGCKMNNKKKKRYAQQLCKQALWEKEEKNER